MASKRVAQASVLLFLLVLVPSMLVIIHGSRHPNYYRPIAKGETLPTVSMPDASGQLVRLCGHRSSHLMLVGAPSLDLTAAQRNWIAQLATHVEAAVPVETVVVTSERNPTTAATKVCPTASTMLVDEDHSLLSLLGSGSNQPVVCVVNRTGQLVFRALVPSPADAASQMANLSEVELRQLVDSVRVIATR